MITKLESGVLPAKEEWESHMHLLKAQTKSSTKAKVQAALESAVKQRIPNEKCGLLLSGGVDSSFIALLLKKFDANLTCYSVGLKDSPDIIAAKKAADLLGLKLICKEFSISEAGELIKRTAQILPHVDVVSIGVGSVVVAAAELAKAEGVSILFAGLGSEEIFAGYERHVKAKDVNEECWNGLTNVIWGRDFTRDTAIATKMKFTVRVPFLDDEVIKSAMGIPGDQKIKGEDKKVSWREIAEEMGLPKEIAWRKKKAAQYGSGFDKALETLAKQKKMQKSEYVKRLI